MNFTGISQLWLRQAVKRWARQRLAVNSAFNTVISGITALKRFSAFLDSCQPPLAAPSGIDRGLIERYLMVADTTTGRDDQEDVTNLPTAFLDENRRYRWLETIKPDAVLYHDELSSRHLSLPRFIPEPVMAQMESEANLARLLPRYRHLVVVIAETGLRAGEACTLAFEAIVADSSGWSCLRFYSAKMRTEQLVPLSPSRRRGHPRPAASRDTNLAGRLAVAVPGAEPDAAAGLQHFPQRVRLLAETNRTARRHRPSRTRDPPPATPHPRDKAHQPRCAPTCDPTPPRTRQPHDDRGVRPPARHHVESRVRTVLPDHVDVEGRLLGFDPDAATADAEWVKHNLARAADALPNGYCGRPPKQECPHPNACLTCPQFQTTIEFLPVHRQQKALTEDLIDAADAAGRQRLADNHRRVAANLDKIITALEDLPPAADSGND